MPRSTRLALGPRERLKLQGKPRPRLTPDHHRSRSERPTQQRQRSSDLIVLLARSRLTRNVFPRPGGACENECLVKDSLLVYVGWRSQVTTPKARVITGDKRRRDCKSGSWGHWRDWCACYLRPRRWACCRSRSTSSATPRALDWNLPLWSRSHCRRRCLLATRKSSCWLRKQRDIHRPDVTQLES